GRCRDIAELGGADFPASPDGHRDWHRGVLAAESRAHPDRGARVLSTLVRLQLCDGLLSRNAAGGTACLLNFGRYLPPRSVAVAARPQAARRAQCAAGSP